MKLTHANIIQILGIESLPLDDRKAIVDETTSLVETETMNRVLESLSETDREKLVNALGEENDEAVAQILNDAGINIPEIMDEEIEKIKQDFIKISKEI